MTTTTKTALLDAAEQVVADEGVRGASLRAITKLAGTNLAAVSYHFGSKEGLLQEVFTRRLAPINAKRLEMLEAAISASDKPDLDAVLRSFAQPALEAVKRHPDGPTLRRMMARVVYGERPEFMEELFHRNFAELFERFLQALGEALPNLDRSSLVLQFHFFIGVFAHTIAADDKLGVVLPEYDPADVEGITQSIVRFGADGMQAANDRDQVSVLPVKPRGPGRRPPTPAAKAGNTTKKPKNRKTQVSNAKTKVPSASPRKSRTR